MQLHSTFDVAGGGYMNSRCLSMHLNSWPALNSWPVKAEGVKYDEFDN